MNIGSPFPAKYNNEFRVPGDLGLNVFFKPLQECDSEHYSKHLTRCVGSVLISLNMRGEAADACRAGIAEQHEVNWSLEEGSL